MATFSISGISNTNLSSILNTNGTITIKPKITVSDTTTPYYVHLLLVTNNGTQELIQSTEIKGTKTVDMASRQKIESLLYSIGTNINYSSFVLRVTVSTPTPNTIAIVTKDITITNDLSVPTMSSYSNTRAIDNNMYSFNIVSEFRYGSVFSSSTATLTASDGTKYTANGTLQSDGKTIVYLFTAQTWSNHFTDKKYDVAITVKNTKNQTLNDKVPFNFYSKPTMTNWSVKRLNGVEDIVIYRGNLEISEYQTGNNKNDLCRVNIGATATDVEPFTSSFEVPLELFSEPNDYGRINCNYEIAVAGDPNNSNKWSSEVSYTYTINVRDRIATTIIASNKTIPKGIPTMAFRTDGTVGVALGGYYDDALGGLLQLYGVTNTNSYFKSSRTNVAFIHTRGAREIQFGIGSGGNNRGIYDVDYGNWVFGLNSSNEPCIGDVAWGDGSNKLFYTKEVTVSKVSITKSSYVSSSVDCSVSGYTPIGVIGYRTANSSTGGTGTANAYWGRCYTNGNTAYYLVRNADTSNTIVIDIIMKILYIKTL